MKTQLLFVLLLVYACSPNEQNESLQENEESEIQTIPRASNSNPSFKILPDDQQPLTVEGQAIARIKWSDKNGTWYSVFTEEINLPNETGCYRVYKFKFDSTTHSVTLFDLYSDSVECEDADVVAYVDKKELLISDLDSDHIGEVTIVYTLGCTWDVSPSRSILVMNVEKEYYKLEGFSLDFPPTIPKTDRLNIEDRTNQDMPDGYFPGKYKNDDDFEDLPETYLEYARKTWLQFLELNRAHKLKEMGE